MRFGKFLTCAMAAFTACSISITAAGSAFADGLITESVSREYLALGSENVKNGLLFTELEDGTYEVGYNYNGSKPSGKVVIPETFNGKQVTRIAEAGFYGCSGLTGVTVPDSVTSAGANAFAGTKFLNDQKGPVKYAGKIAVYCDSEAKSVTIKDGTLGLADKLFLTVEELEKAVLPESLINIGNMTFMGCEKLSTVNIPASLKTIGSGVFYGCAALNVKIPESITGIGSYAFAESGITAANIPNVTKIGKGAFENSALGMGNLHVGDQYIDIGGLAFAGTYYYNSLGTEKYVGTVFIGCDDSVTDVNLKKGTTAIADMAFSGRKNLKSVTIPSGVKTIGADAFFNCTQLSSAIVIPNGVERIGGDAFRLCGNITSVSLPISLKSVGAGAFYGCGNLKTVNYPGSVADWGKISAGDDEAMPTVSPVFGKDPKKPEPVKGLKVTETTANKVTLTWNKSDLANKYQIDVYKNGKWYTAGKTYGDTTAFTVTGLSQFTEYNFRVYAFTHNTYGSSVSIKAKTKVASVSGVKTSPTSDSVSVSWNKNNSADFYQIDLYKDGKWSLLLKTKNNTTSCSVSKLSPKTEYKFRIFAFIGNNYSSPTEFKVTTAASDKPEAVTNLSASPSTNSVKLSWDKNSTADSYQIDMYKNGKWTYVAKITGTSYNVTGLSSNTSYQLRVFAFKGSKYSSAASIKTTTKAPASNNPTAVTNLSASPSTNSVKLSWTKNSTADSYQVDMYKNGKWTYVAKITGTSYNVTGLSRNTSYQFRVFAFKGSNYSSLASVSATTGASSGKPTAVTGLSASPSANSVKLSWNKNSTADSYQIDMYKNGKWTYVAKITGTSYNVTGLSRNTSYQFRVFAFKGSNYSSLASVSATTGASSRKPTAVTGLSASPSANSVKLSWNKNSTADSYQIDMYKNGKWTYVAKITGTSYNVTGLSRNTSYQFRVFAFKGSNYSSAAGVNISTQKMLAASTTYAAAPSGSKPAELSNVNMMLKGIDVSGWQGVIDFNAVKESGVDFVIVKAGESNHTVDTWETNYANAKHAGLMVGAYWYSHATTLDGGKQEAKAFTAALKGKKFEFPVFFDMEESEQFDKGKTFCTDLVNTFCGELEKAGYCAGVYCSTYWFTNFVNDNVRLKRPAWIADYRGKCYYDAAYGMWQHGIGDDVAGIDGNCDLNFGYIDYSKYITANKLNGY